MRRLLSSIMPLCSVAAAIVVASIRFDLGQTSWLWFQRSGSLVVLLGAVLSYRSIVRLGVRGVGGVNTTVLRARLVSVDDTGPTQRATVAYDQEALELLRQE